MLPRFVRLSVIALGGIASGTAGVVLATNDFDSNSIGVIRFSRAALTVGSIFCDYAINVYYKLDNSELSEEAVKEEWSNAHRRSAQRLLELCRSNRGIFIKVGQHLGGLDYLIPSEYTDTLKILHSQAPESKLDEVFQVIEEDFQKPVEEVFSKFEGTPLGAASLAQVYRACLKSGEEVAVKVQHRKVRDRSAVDMNTMSLLAHIAAWAFPDFKLLWIVEETRKNLPVELDFLNEARNAEKIKKNVSEYSSWLMIPKIYWQYCSTRVLTMEFCEGAQINNVDYMKAHSIDPSDICSKLGTLYSKMIFDLGYVHCDPHPGNILVRKRGDSSQLVLIDHGLYVTLTPTFQERYSKFWLNVISGDMKSVEESCEELGVRKSLCPSFACMATGRSWKSIKSKEREFLKKQTREEQEEIREIIGNYIPEMAEILSSVPREMLLIFKVNDLIRGVEHSLSVQKSMSSFMTISKFCVDSIYQKRRAGCEDFSTFLKIWIQRQIAMSRIVFFQLFLFFRSLLTIPLQ